MLEEKKNAREERRRWRKENPRRRKRRKTMKTNDKFKIFKEIASLMGFFILLYVP